nr:hypothetical protein [Gloeotrichia echinulata DEX184]
MSILLKKHTKVTQAMGRKSMTNINTTHSESFPDTESLLENLSDMDSMLITGGKTMKDKTAEDNKFSMKLAELSNQTITSLVDLFFNSPKRDIN